MSREFPDFVDPWKAADGKRTFEGTMPLQRMRRLAPLLATGTSGPDVRFSARFGHDRQGMVRIRLEVEAELPLLCQRSLEPYLEQVQRHSSLTVIETVDEQGDLPDDAEPVLVEDRRLALLDLVEEELLLAVPQVPRNPDLAAVDMSTDGAPAETTGAGEAETHRPFAGLAGLMSGKEKH